MNPDRLFRIAGWTGAAMTICLAGTARATLGGAPSAPPAVDRAATVRTLARTANRAASASAGASASAPNAAGYMVSEMTLGSGTVIREYVSAAGTVFGVAWRGPVKPDFASLFGQYFPQYISAIEASHAARGVRAPVSVASGVLVVQSGGPHGRVHRPRVAAASVAASRDGR